MVRFSSHWRGLLQVTQGYLWPPLLSLPPWGLCSLLLCLTPQHHCPLVPLQSKVRAQECWWLWRIHHAQPVTAEREGSGTLTLLTLCALFSLPAEQEENSLCRTSRKSQTRRSSQFPHNKRPLWCTDKESNPGTHSFSLNYSFTTSDWKASLLPSQYFPQRDLGHSPCP